MIDGLDDQTFSDLLAVARAPMEIRGYGPVKEATIPAVKAEVARRMARLV